MAMSIKVTFPGGTTNQTLTVDYGYGEKVNGVYVEGSRRYGHYKLVANDTDQGITANTVTVDDRDMPLFNTLISGGTVTVADATFNQVSLGAVGSGTITNGTSTTVINVPAGVTAGYDVKVVNTTNATALTVTKNYGNNTFTVASASNVATNTNFQYAVLTYNTNFAYTDDALDYNDVTKSGGAS